MWDKHETDIQNHFEARETAIHGSKQAAAKARDKRANTVVRNKPNKVFNVLLNQYDSKSHEEKLKIFHLSQTMKNGNFTKILKDLGNKADEEYQKSIAGKTP